MGGDRMDSSGEVSSRRAAGDHCMNYSQPGKWGRPIKPHEGIA